MPTRWSGPPLTYLTEDIRTLILSDLLMPKLSTSMEFGTVVQWLVPNGQLVQIGDELVEIETDKTTVVYAAEVAGILEVIASEGARCEVGTVIARLRDPGEAGGDGHEIQSAEAGPPATHVTSKRTTDAPAQRAPTRADLVSGTARAMESTAGWASKRPAKDASPLARRAARLHGVALETVHGSGPRGKIRQRDVLESAGLNPDALAGSRPPQLLSARGQVPPPGEADGDTIGHGRTTARLIGATETGQQHPLTAEQTAIARRMVKAGSTVPAFHLQMDVRLDKLVQLREQLRSVVTNEEQPSLNDFIVKAAALALRQHPLVNGSYSDNGFILHEQVNVGIAVAADGGLFVPTIFDADRKGVGTIAHETRDLAERARNRRLTPAEVTGGTFTVSNLGMFGVTVVAPIINPPQAAILGVGAARNILVQKHGGVVAEKVSTLTLSCDHRILYGADGARFLTEITRVLESPMALLL